MKLGLGFGGGTDNSAYHAPKKPTMARSKSASFGSGSGSSMSKGSGVPKIDTLGSFVIGHVDGDCKPKIKKVKDSVNVKKLEGGMKVEQEKTADVIKRMYDEGNHHVEYFYPGVDDTQSIPKGAGKVFEEGLRGMAGGNPDQTNPLEEMVHDLKESRATAQRRLDETSNDASTALDMKNIRRRLANQETRRAWEEITQSQRDAVQDNLEERRNRPNRDAYLAQIRADLEWLEQQQVDELQRKVAQTGQTRWAYARSARASAGATPRPELEVEDLLNEYPPPKSQSKTSGSSSSRSRVGTSGSRTAPTSDVSTPTWEMIDEPIPRGIHVRTQKPPSPHMRVVEEGIKAPKEPLHGGRPPFNPLAIHPSVRDTFERRLAQLEANAQGLEAQRAGGHGTANADSLIEEGERLLGQLTRPRSAAPRLTAGDHAEMTRMEARLRENHIDPANVVQFYRRQHGSNGKLAPETERLRMDAYVTALRNQQFRTELAGEMGGSSAMANPSGSISSGNTPAVRARLTQYESTDMRQREADLGRQGVNTDRLMMFYCQQNGIHMRNVTNRDRLNAYTSYANDQAFRTAMTGHYATQDAANRPSTAGRRGRR